MAAKTPGESPPSSQEGTETHDPFMGKKSYVSAVQNKQVLENHVVQVEVVDGEPTVDIPDELLNSVPLWEDFLEGRFLDTAPHVSRVHILVNKI